MAPDCDVTSASVVTDETLTDDMGYTWTYDSEGNLVGYEVDEKLDLSPEKLMEEIAGAHAVIIRSATTITDEIMSKGENLVVIGRAGIGLDNVDVESATKRGIMVVNAPKSNILSAAEHTLALLLSQIVV